MQYICNRIAITDKTIYPMYLKKLLAFTTSFGLIALYSCNKEEKIQDLAPPSISVLSVNTDNTSDTICGDTYDNVLYYQAGDTIRLRLRIEDDQNLSQLKIEIHDNADCHGHGERPLSAFEYLNILDISGKELEKDFQIPIPTDAAIAAYHFQLQAIDAVGKESAEIEYNLRIVP